MATDNKGHRDDIDGLRSIAVLLVVLHHAGFTWVPGGYVGVDIFFVISGFLITGIIYSGLLKGTFTFTDFYVRRVKRLMPALFVMLLATTIASFIYLYPSDLEKYARSLIWVVLYGGNFFFWLEHGGYFEGNTQEAPLLHTWSLAVEEQYYLIWPLYLILGLKLFKERVFAVLTIALLIVCIAVSELALNVTIGAAYYLLPTRMFELMIGSVIAMNWRHIPRMPAYVTHGISLAGLAAIAYAAMALNEASRFPGINALYPTVGAACLLIANREHTGCINRILALKPFVFIGLISYSLYLWHWPVLVFVRYQAIPMTLAVQLSCIGISILLAWLSWRFVETPVRKARTPVAWPVMSRWLVQPMLATFLVAAVMIQQQGLHTRFPPEIALMDQAYNTLSHELRPQCHASLREAGRQPHASCVLGSKDDTSAFKGFMFGDSHANHLAGFVDEVARQANIQVQDYTLDQCPAIFHFAWGRNSLTAAACERRNDQALEYIQQNEFDYVLLGSSWPARAIRLYEDGGLITDQEESARKIEQAFLGTIREIVSLGAIPVVFDDIPFLGLEDPKCPIKKASFNSDLDCRVRKNANTFFEEVVTRAQIKYPQMVRITLSDYMCRNDECVLELDGIPLYSDNDHLNYLGSQHLASKYLEHPPKAAGLKEMSSL